MAKAVEIITRSLRILGVVDAAETPAWDDYATAVDALNGLGYRWLENGLLLDWQEVTSFESTLTTSPLENEALVYGLAVRIRPEYGQPLQEDVLAQAQQALASLWRDRLVGRANGGEVGDVVYRALRSISGGGVAQYPDQFNLGGALYALNNIGSRWAKSGLIESWTPVSSVADAFPEPDESREAFSSHLAIRLASEYGVPIRDELVSFAQEGVSNLWRDRLEATPVRNAGSIIKRALRLINTSGTFPEGFSMYGAIDVLNSMMTRWEANGISMGWSNVASLSDDLTFPPEADEAVAYNLALKLGPEYGYQIRPDIHDFAERGLAALRRDVMVANPIVMRAPSRGYDIRSDDYY